MEAQLEQLDGDRVRLTVEVPADEVHHAVEHATHDLAERVKVPGFRRGQGAAAGARLSGSASSASTPRRSSRTSAAGSGAPRARNRVRPTEQPDVPATSCRRPTTRAGVHGRVPGAGDRRAGRLDDARGAEARGRGARGRGRRRQLEALQRIGRRALAGRGPPGARGRRRRRRHRLGRGHGPARLRRRARRRAARRRDRGRHPRPARRARAARSPGSSATARPAARRSRSRSSTRRCCRRSTTSSRSAASEFDTLDELRADIDATGSASCSRSEAEGEFRQAAVDELVKASKVEPARPRGRGAHARAAERVRPPARGARDRRRRLPPGDRRHRRRSSSSGCARRPPVGSRGAELDRCEARARSPASSARGRRRQARIEVTTTTSATSCARRARATRTSRSSSRRAAPTASAPTCGFKKAVDRIAAEVSRSRQELAQSAREASGRPARKKAASSTRQKLWTPGSKE